MALLLADTNDLVNLVPSEIGRIRIHSFSSTKVSMSVELKTGLRFRVTREDAVVNSFLSGAGWEVARDGSNEPFFQQTP